MQGSPSAISGPPMSDEREYISTFELVRWLVPSVLVVVGVIFFILYSNAAPAITSGTVTP